MAREKRAITPEFSARDKYDATGSQGEGRGKRPRLAPRPLSSPQSSPHRSNSVSSSVTHGCGRSKAWKGGGEEEKDDDETEEEGNEKDDNKTEEKEQEKDNNEMEKEEQEKDDDEMDREEQEKDDDEMDKEEQEKDNDEMEDENNDDELFVPTPPRGIPQTGPRVSAPLAVGVPTAGISAEDISCVLRGHAMAMGANAMAMAWLTGRPIGAQDAAPKARKSSAP